MRALVLLWLVTAVGCRDGGVVASARPRVVSLHDVTTEIVVALGAVDRLVGVAEPVDPTPDGARAVAAVPRVAGLESVLAMEPEVVLGLGVVAEQDPDLVARLREAGVEVRLADPATVDDVAALVETTGARLDAPGDVLAASVRARAAVASVRVERPRRVFVYDCCQPPFTAGGRTVETELIARAGGVNLFADLDADWGHVAWEAVVARRPELIVIHAYRWDGQADVDGKRRALAEVPGLAGVPVVVIPLGEVLGGLRSLDGLTRLRAAIGAAP